MPNIYKRNSNNGWKDFNGYANLLFQFQNPTIQVLQVSVKLKNTYIIFSQNIL